MANAIMRLNDKIRAAFGLSDQERTAANVHAPRLDRVVMRTARLAWLNEADAAKFARCANANPKGAPRKAAYADIYRVVNAHLAKGASLKRALSEANAELEFCDPDAKPETLDKAWRRVLADKARGDNLTP